MGGMDIGSFLFAQICISCNGGYRTISTSLYLAKEFKTNTYKINLEQYRATYYRVPMSVSAKRPRRKVN